MMNAKISDLTEEDKKVFEDMRDWLRSHLKPEHRDKFAEIDCKVFVVHSIIEGRRFDPNNAWQMRALGLGLGDAVAQKLGLVWVIVEDEHGRLPELRNPGTSLRLNAFTAVQKRIHQDGKVEIIPLFHAFCQEIERLRAPKRSLWDRLLGRRLA